MVIDKDKLISLLIEKTGSEKKDVEQQLAQLIYRIRNAAEEGKTFEIEGFGIFGLENDRLHFTPSDRLKTEINQKYIGMKPIELIGAFKGVDVEPTDGPDENVGGEDSEKGRWAFDESSAADQKRIEKAVFGKSFDDEIPPTPEQEEMAETPEPVIPPPVIPRSSPAVSVSKSGEDAEDDPIGRVVVVVAVLLVVAVAGWLVYDSGFFSGYTNSGTETLKQGTTVQSGELPALQQRNVNNDKPLVTKDETGEPGRSEEVINSSSGTSEQDRYGLKGEIEGSVTTGYTIVVHSFRRPEIARSVQNSLQSEGFRVMILEATVNGTGYYRVGLGQFSTIDAAREAIKQLPEQFQNDNFIKRF